MDRADRLPGSLRKPRGCCLTPSEGALLCLISFGCVLGICLGGFVAVLIYRHNSLDQVRSAELQNRQAIANQDRRITRLERLLGLAPLDF